MKYFLPAFRFICQYYGFGHIGSTAILISWLTGFVLNKLPSPKKSPDMLPQPKELTASYG